MTFQFGLLRTVQKVSRPFRVLGAIGRRDLFLIVTLALATIAAAIKAQLAKRAVMWLAVHPTWLLNEIFLTLFVIAAGIAVFSVRRWQDLRVEVRERKAAQVALRSSEERLDRVFSASPVPIFLIGMDTGKVLACNAEFEVVTGYQSADLVGTTMTALQLFVQTDFSKLLKQRLRNDGRIRNEEVEFRTNTGDVKPALCSATRITYGTDSAVLVALNDISERRLLEQRLEHQAFHDSLTGLPNRALFRLRLEHALLRVPRGGITPHVLFLDLDDFKRVNDTLGHAAGDQLLMTVAERLVGSLRAEDTCARLGGDEFAILIEDGSDQQEGLQLAERLVPLLRAPFQLGGSSAHIGVSIGIAVAEPTETAEEVLRNADLAMYISKTDGKNRVTVYTPSMHEDVAERLRLEGDLHLAVVRNELRVQYQPIVSIETGAILSMEALVRWEHPTKGTLSPNLFIPLAESSGLMVPIGSWVLREACKTTATLQQQFPRTPALTVSVNLSGRQLADPECVHIVERTLHETGLHASSLILEITESMLIHNATEIVERLWALKDLGVKLAIDDFGTGYSSLSYLQRFPVDILKIDKSFIDRIGTGGEESPIARAVVALGNSVSLQMVAEGVETSDQWDRLRELGCDRGQGFLFARPARIDAVVGLLAAEDSSLAAAMPQLDGMQASILGGQSLGVTYTH